MNKYKMKVNIAWLKRKRDGLTKQLAGIGLFVDGSMAKVKRRCGNRNCKCYLKGEKHESYYLMYKVKGVTKAVCLPVQTKRLSMTSYLKVYRGHFLSLEKTNLGER